MPELPDHDVASTIPLPEQLFANRISGDSRGGLLICGMHGAPPCIGRHGPIAGIDYAWTPWFSHADNTSPVQQKLIDWFRYWGHPLEPDNPTELDRAISQTTFRLKYWTDGDQATLQPEKWLDAVRCISRAARLLDASGVLVMSTSLVDTALRAAGPMLAKQDGLLINAATRWISIGSGRLDLRFAETPGAELACCAHPWHPVPYSHVKRCADSMSTWIDAVMDRYRFKQRQWKRTHATIRAQAVVAGAA